MREAMTREIWLLLDSSGLGGIESHVAELAAGLAAAGRVPRVIFLTDFGSHPLRDRLDAAGLAWEALPGGFRALSRRLRQGRPALLHTHGYKANLLGRIAARLAGLPAVSSFHAGERPAGAVGLYDLADRWTAGLAGRVAVSRQIAGRLPWRAEVVPNFVALPDATPGGRPLAVAFVGRMVPEKGPDRFAALAGLVPGPRFLAFGDGPGRAAAEAAAAGRVDFRGGVPGMAGHWAEVGLLAITSRAEGLPLAALEAMAAGVPVAAFALGGLPELVTDGVDGWLAPPDDLPALAAKVAAWAALDGAARDAVGAAARATIAARFGREAGVARLLAVYRKAGADL
jgi:glycosyltransferase involved in cell wall biosynthesis